MSGRVSVIFGGGRGIGAATAVRLAARGDAVVIADRCTDDPRLPYGLASATDLAGAAAAAREAGRTARAGDDPDRVLALAADATDPVAVADVITEAESRLGDIDSVIVTAGVIAGGVPLWKMPETELRAVLDVNLDAVITVARAGIPALLRRPAPRSGRFVAVASAAASRGLPMLAAYCAAKAGVVGLIRALAAELRGTGVTANAVSPGSTDTRILAESARLYGLGSAGEFAVQQPIERLIHPDEIAAHISYLTGPDAAAITGADHPVDGGLAI